ncbi:hypothetical protein MTHERMMSTA1_16010 [Methanosarcina thermophila MST-A1]|uniref:Uncharacterized protein n=1 Tax=Methanosarcina thermophila TaxID=2210 RepID=A0A3G9CTI0_METTE|nr:conserved hypothetical protein [Methanosarcina thermophila]GLI14475.1 hypothetical protein MTHERMMSTA1_16010 [Methanosarcina thermophila MST-A1]
MSFIIFAQIPLLGYSLYIVFLRKGYTLGLGSAVLVLCLLWTVGFFTCFSSPYAGGISEAISQNEAEGIQWLSEVKETYPYIMFSPDMEGSDALPSILSSSSGLTDKGSQKPSRNDLEKDISVEKVPENEPFYVVETTFSDAYIARAQRSDGTSDPAGENSLKVEPDYPVYKIYDSLNIEIYEHIP